MRKLNEPEVREQYQVGIINRFAALENSDDDEDINRTWGKHKREYPNLSERESGFG